MSERQSEQAQRGEIEFRRRLVRQQVSGESLFVDEFDAAGIEEVLRGRMARTLADITPLRDASIARAPWLEIGSERGQRALVMENDLGMPGVAADLSFDMQQSCAHYARTFVRPRLPLRVVCDANDLPFRSDSLPFVFCYETLHHFPDPAPVVREAWRVLAPGGTFLFDEEPFRKVLRFKLARGRKLYSQESRGAGLARRLLDRFFTEPACNEVEYGIVENHDLPLSTWRRTLAAFADKDVELRSLRVVRSRLYGWREPLTFALAWLLGGAIRGRCRKAGTLPDAFVDREAALACPRCVRVVREPVLERIDSGFRCASCECAYPVVDGVAFLLSPGKRATLYPGIDAAAERHDAAAPAAPVSVDLAARTP